MGRFLRKLAAKRRNRKRRVRKAGIRRARANPLVNKSMVRMGLGFPKKLITTHKYSGNFAMASTLGVAGFTHFACNGMFDPDLSGVGHQPMYFDQYTALYDHYTVIGSRIKVKFCNQAGTNVTGRFLVYVNDDTTNNTTSIDALSENSSSKWQMIAAGDNNTHTIVKKWSAKKTFGGSILGNDRLQGDVTANPAELSVFTLAYAANTAVTQSVEVIIEIDYIAVWDELKELASS